MFSRWRRPSSSRHYGLVLRAAVQDLYRARWGKPTKVGTFVRGDKSVEVGRWDTEGVTIYATVGGAETGSGDHRYEVFCGLSPAQDSIAQVLASAAAYSAEQGVLLRHGDTVPLDAPPWPGSLIQRMLVVEPMAEFLDPLQLPGGLHVAFLQVIPLLDEDLDLRKTKGTAALLTSWEERRVPFWSSER